MESEDDYEEQKVSDSEFSKDGVKTAPSGDALDSIVLICNTFNDFVLWRKSLESYVV